MLFFFFFISGLISNCLKYYNLTWCVTTSSLTVLCVEFTIQLIFRPHDNAFTNCWHYYLAVLLCFQFHCSIVIECVVCIIRVCSVRMRMKILRLWWMLIVCYEFSSELFVAPRLTILYSFSFNFAQFLQFHQFNITKIYTKAFAQKQ